MEWDFLLTSVILALSPGAGVLYTLATGLSQGARASMIAAFSCMLGIIPHLTAALLGLAAILHASALFFNILKYAGIVYLLYMAWQALQVRGALGFDETGASRAATVRPARRILRDGVLINILNPKLSIFFVAFLPQFIDVGESHAIWRMAELSAIFMLITLIVFSLYGVFAGIMRHHILSRTTVMNWLRRCFAAAFAALAVKLLMMERN